MGSYSFVNTVSYEAAFNSHTINQCNNKLHLKAKYPVLTTPNASQTLRSLFYLKYRVEERNPGDKRFFSLVFNSGLKYCRRCGKAFIPVSIPFSAPKNREINN